MIIKNTHCKPRTIKIVLLLGSEISCNAVTNLFFIISEKEIVSLEKSISSRLIFCKPKVTIRLKYIL